MGTNLHNILRSLCFSSEWKYAIFWKLKHRTRMVLTWEDAYYNREQHDPSENKCFSEAPETLYGERYSHDPLGLAVAKMSYQVYSLGEGIVGQVAVTGKHQWIFADKHVTSSLSSLEFSDGWQSQFSAGVRTILVVAVVPYGVVQLGSLSKVVEDIRLVTQIKEIFFSLQDSSVGHATNPRQYSMNSSLWLLNSCASGSAMEVIPSSLYNTDRAAKKREPNDWFTESPCLQKQSDSSCISSPPVIHSKTVVDMVNKCEGLGLSTLENDETINLLKLRKGSYLEHQNHIGMNLISDQNQLCGAQTSITKNLGRVSEHNVPIHSNNSVENDVNVCDVTIPVGGFGADLANSPSYLLDSTTVDDRVKLDALVSCINTPESSDNIKNDLKKLEYQAEPIDFDTMNAFLKFSAGCELHEALGPAFLKRFMYLDRDTQKPEAGNVVEIPEVMSSSQMTYDTGSEDLLEAVVGNICHSNSDVKSEKSVSKSVQSLLTIEKVPEPSVQTNHVINSTGFSINQCSSFKEDTQNCSNSTGMCGAISSKGFSSTCPSTCNEQVDRCSEPAKNNKKRARPGENSRPRPRDRQLIQDRIKELRELVPNGSKCSIDSLLERTIKHMLFLESITKHADKLNKCAESKMHQKGADTSGYEQGSSWAVEVGGHLRVSSIIVENLNKNGQMLVEMLCEECCHFLEIAEAIRSLGLTILRGVTEAHGEKTWICFVVEGHNSRIMHRMDVLWQLVQILQPKTTN